MTGTRDPQQDGSIQAMLRDSGLDASTELRDSLEQLRALVPEQAPAPRADLAALLAAGAYGSPEHGSPEAATTAMPAVASLADRRRGRKRRLAVVGGAVVAAMSLGAGAVAASSEDFRQNVSRTIGVMFHPAAPAPEHAQPSPAEIPALPAQSTAPAVVPGSAAPAAPATRAPGPAAPGPSAPTHSAGTSGVGGVLPTQDQHQGTPGAPALPGLPGLGDGEDRNQEHRQAPAMPALPGGVPTEVPGRNQP